MDPVLTKRYARILSGVFLWTLTVLANAASSSGTTLLEDEREWLVQAAHLVQLAQSGKAEAVQYNKDVRESRAQLRQHIQHNNKQELSQQHRQLHSMFLILDILLKSAAACQTAGHIVCPPLLMSQLNTVLKNAYAKLDEIKASPNTSGSG
jgi:hypothetical protein